MGKFSSQVADVPKVTGPIISAPADGATTFEGVPAFKRDARSELFLLAVSDFVSEGSFYESANERDARMRDLVAKATKIDADWVARFAVWLRTKANMRSASVVVACEYVKAGGEGGRKVIDSVCQRADEPAEILSYWMLRFGRNVPKPVKRGVADATRRLYTQRNTLKYNTNSASMKFGDVLQLVHTTPRDDDQARLFKYILDTRYQGSDAMAVGLEMITERKLVESCNVETRREMLSPELLRNAGMTWESVAGWLQGPMDAEAWEAIIPSMGYMALLRNLRNFDEAGVSDKVATAVSAKLSDPEEVAKSRQLPLRFLSAYRNAPSLRWSWALEQASNLSLENVPTLAGNTLVLVDTSYSMNDHLSQRSNLMRWDAAAMFGIALARKCENVNVVSFSNHTVEFPMINGGSLLSDLKRWNDDGFFLGSGTETAKALTRHFHGHDRVVVLTDEQSSYSGFYRHDNVDEAIPANVPMYTWNLAGFQYGDKPSGTKNRWTFGGLTDRGFDMIPLLERGNVGNWPF